LSPQFTELLAPKSCLQFHDLGKVLSPGHARRKIKATFDVAFSNIDDLTVEGYNPLTGRADRFLPTL